MTNNDLDTQSLAFIITVIPLCSMGYLMMQMRATIFGICNPNPIYHRNVTFCHRFRLHQCPHCRSTAGNNVCGMCTHSSHAAKIYDCRLIVDISSLTSFPFLFLSGNGGISRSSSKLAIRVAAEEHKPDYFYPIQFPQNRQCSSEVLSCAN